MEGKIMGKVYIVTRGSYSEYQIVAVFSSPETAEEYIRKLRETHLSYCPAYDDAKVEKWDIDKPKGNWVMTVVRMSKSGNVLDAWLDTSPQRCFDFEGNLSWGVATEDKERAIKVVNKKRGQILALGLWGKPDKIAEMSGEEKVK